MDAMVSFGNSFSLLSGGYGEVIIKEVVWNYRCEIGIKFRKNMRLTAAIIIIYLMYCMLIGWHIQRSLLYFFG